MICVAVAVALTGALLVEFQSRRTPPALGQPVPSTAIVFTGQFDRIDQALTLLERGTVDRIFISGVNLHAGIFIDRFETQLF